MSGCLGKRRPIVSSDTVPVHGDELEDPWQYQLFGAPNCCEAVFDSVVPPLFSRRAGADIVIEFVRARGDCLESGESVLRGILPSVDE